MPNLHVRQSRLFAEAIVVPLLEVICERTGLRAFQRKEQPRDGF